MARTPGRPTDLTPEVAEGILSRVRAGSFRHDAAQAAGVPKRTFSRWCSRGRKEESGLYVDFWHALLDAEAEAITSMVAVVTTAAQTDWRAAAWFLERKRPDQFGRHVEEFHAMKKRFEEIMAVLQSKAKAKKN